jgi:hypothetical protein
MADHDLWRQAKQLQQALASNKMPVAFFIGAGCPTAVRVGEPGHEGPLIPDIAGLTHEVRQKLAASGVHGDPFDLVCQQLTADGNAVPNIEDALNHVRALRQAAGKRDACGLSADKLGRLDEAICNAIDECVRRDLPSSITPYHQVASWISAIQREHAVEVFTTNYDLLMEQALEGRRVPYFDGFTGSDRPFFDPASMEVDRFAPRWSRLWKLHGSINWWQGQDKRVYRAKEGLGATHLIHPSHLKYEESRRMPYLAMIDRLRAFLRRAPAVVVTCGFSFSDQHLNEVFTQGLEGNPSAVCFGLLFAELSQYPQAEQLARRRPNLNVLARDVAILGSREGRWAMWRVLKLRQVGWRRKKGHLGPRRSGRSGFFLVTFVGSANSWLIRLAWPGAMREATVPSEPTLMGTVQDVKGATVRVALDPATVSGTTFVEGQTYRVGQVGSFVRIPLGYIDLFGVVSQVGAGAAPERLQESQPYGNRWVTVQLVGGGRRARPLRARYLTVPDDR